MIVVTGGAGMIGSNIVGALNKRGRTDILVVDRLYNGKKMHNLAYLDIADYIDCSDFISHIRSGVSFGKIDAIFHLGACSSTTEWDGQFLMRNNYEYSKSLFHHCQNTSVPFIYASSASVYGMGHNGFVEMRECERPINMYAYSKFQFDQYIRRFEARFESQVVGLRYFNVYGPNEAHKGSMASTSFHFNNQLIQSNCCKLFSGSGGYKDGEQMRDFVYVEDCVDVNLWFFDNPDKTGIFNVGTGKAETFNEVAKAAISWHEQYRGNRGSIEYIPFPESLEGAYQNFTQANISRLRDAGYSAPFHSVKEGVHKYLNIINKPLD